MKLIPPAFAFSLCCLLFFTVVPRPQSPQSVGPFSASVFHADSPVWYDGVQSRVTGQECLATIHFFSKEKPSFSEVIEAEFQVTNLKDGETHDFSLWFPSSGPLQNVPVCIVDKPRWWLRVELTLEAESAQQGGLRRQNGLVAKCAETSH